MESKRRDAVLKRWARYREAKASAEKSARAMVRESEYSKARDGTWTAQSRLEKKRIRKTGFRTKRDAREWMRIQSRAFLESRNAKLLGALPAADKTIAAAFEKIGARGDSR